MSPKNNHAWSVVAHGKAELLGNQEIEEQVEGFPLFPWNRTEEPLYQDRRARTIRTVIHRHGTPPARQRVTEPTKLALFLDDLLLANHRRLRSFSRGPRRYPERLQQFISPDLNGKCNSHNRRT